MFGEEDPQSKLKADILFKELNHYGYQKDNRISKSELLLFLNRKYPNGKFDDFLSEKLFNILNLDETTTISVEEFVYGYLQLEEEMKRNVELIHSQYLEQEKIYNNILDLCQKYESEKYNEQGFCEEGKFYGDIIDIQIKNHLEIAQDILLKIMYGEQQLEIRRAYSQNGNIIVNQPFEFHAFSKKENLQLILQGDTGYGYEYDLGSKIYSLQGISNQDEFFVRIEIPEVIYQGHNEDGKLIAAEINAKIAMLWSKFQFYEAQRIKEEPKLNKLRMDVEEAEEILKKVQYIYGDINEHLRNLDEEKEKMNESKDNLSEKSNSNSEKGDKNNKMFVFTSKKFAVEFNNMRIDEVLKKGKKISYNYNAGLSSTSKKQNNDNIKQSQSVHDFKNNSINSRNENNLENMRQNENIGLNMNIGLGQNFEDMQQKENFQNNPNFEDLEEKESIHFNEKEEMKSENSENLNRKEEKEQNLEKHSIQMSNHEIPNNENINYNSNNINMNENMMLKSNGVNNSNIFKKSNISQELNNSYLQKSNELKNQNNLFPTQSMTQNQNLIKNSNVFPNQNTFPNANIIDKSINNSNMIKKSNVFASQNITDDININQKSDDFSKQNKVEIEDNLQQNKSIVNSNLMQKSNLFPNPSMVQNSMVQKSGVIPNQSQVYNSNVLQQSNVIQNQDMVHNSNIIKKSNIIQNSRTLNSNIIQKEDIFNSPEIHKNTNNTNNQNLNLSSQYNYENANRNINTDMPVFQKPIVSQSTNKAIIQENILPLKYLPEKVNNVIYDNNVSSLPIIEGKKAITYSTIPSYNKNNLNTLSQVNQFNTTTISYQGPYIKNQLYQF